MAAAVANFYFICCFDIFTIAIVSKRKEYQQQQNIVGLFVVIVVLQSIQSLIAINE